MTDKDFQPGDRVLVRPMKDDVFCHEFVGHVFGHRNDMVLVVDQDDDVFDCLPEQLQLDNT